MHRMARCNASRVRSFGKEFGGTSSRRDDNRTTTGHRLGDREAERFGECRSMDHDIQRAVNRCSFGHESDESDATRKTARFDFAPQFRFRELRRGVMPVAVEAEKSHRSHVVGVGQRRLG